MGVESEQQKQGKHQQHHKAKTWKDIEGDKRNKARLIAGRTMDLRVTRTGGMRAGND